MPKAVTEVSVSARVVVESHEVVSVNDGRREIRLYFTSGGTPAVAVFRGLQINALCSLYSGLELGMMVDVVGTLSVEWSGSVEKAVIVVQKIAAVSKTVLGVSNITMSATIGTTPKTKWACSAGGVLVMTMRARVLHKGEFVGRPVYVQFTPEQSLALMRSDVFARRVPGRIRVSGSYTSSSATGFRTLLVERMSATGARSPNAIKSGKSETPPVDFEITIGKDAEVTTRLLESGTTARGTVLVRFRHVVLGGLQTCEAQFAGPHSRTLRSLRGGRGLSDGDTIRFTAEVVNRPGAQLVVLRPVSVHVESSADDFIIHREESEVKAKLRSAGTAAVTFGRRVGPGRPRKTSIRPQGSIENEK